ncbi:MAG: DUF4214 domain-containing protein [Burkholderiales bacterium]|nr:DUF4214 domain-containing protein [Burkholderiales bacterium]
MVAPADGQYALRPAFAGSYSLRVSLAPVQPDDEGDLPSTAQVLDASRPFQPTGQFITGTEGDDQLFGGLRGDTVSGGAGRDELLGGAGDDLLDGGPDNDTLEGQQGRDTLQGGPGNDRLRGGDEDDTLQGGSGDDTLFGNAGNDRIDGGDGIDTAHYQSVGPVLGLKRVAEGWQVSNPAAAEGSDLLVNVERVEYGNTALALDLDGHAGQVARILGALLGPATLKQPALVGLGLSLLDGGIAYPDLVAAAVASPQFAQAAGSRSNTAFVELLYRNIAGTAPTAAEAAPYVALLDRGELSQTQLAQLACDSTLTALAIDLVGLQASGLAFTPA